MDYVSSLMCAVTYCGSYCTECTKVCVCVSCGNGRGDHGLWWRKPATSQLSMAMPWLQQGLMRGRPVPPSPIGFWAPLTLAGGEHQLGLGPHHVQYDGRALTQHHALHPQLVAGVAEQGVRARRLHHACHWEHALPLVGGLGGGVPWPGWGTCTFLGLCPGQK